MDACRTMTTDEILALPDVQERIEVYNEQTEKFKEMVRFWYFHRTWKDLFE